MAYQILSKYQQNFTRLGIVCVDEIKAVFKDSFESQIKPVDLYNAINSCPQLNTGKDKLNLFQLKICYISPPQVPDYDMFDVSLLYKLIRNLCPNLTPTKGWGKTPDSNHLRIGDDIERFRDIRNKMFAHLKSSEVPDNIFVQFWKELQGSFHRAQKFITSFGYSVNYKENLKYIEKLDLGCEDLKRYKFQMEFLMMLRNQSQNTDVPKIKVNGNTKVNCGDDARFQALTEHCPSNHNWPITWEIEKGSEIKVIDIKKEKYRGSSSTELVIRKVVKEDAGEYRAVISRELDGEHFKILSNILKLDALGDLPKLEISQATSAKNCVIIHYSCCVQNTSNCLNSIQWTRNGDLLMIKTAKYNGGGLTDKYLKIFSPTEEDSGQYRCKLSNAVGSDEKCIVLGVPELQMCGQHTDLFGSNVIIEPHIKSCPPVDEAIWQKNQVSFPEKFQSIHIDDPKYFGSSSNPRKPFLVIRKASHEDILCYRLQVSNGIGTASRVVSLRLTGDLPSVFTNHDTDFSEHRVTLICKVLVTEGSPDVEKVVWTKEKKQIDILGSGGKYTGGNETYPSLVIHGVNSNDAGEYQCRVSNAVGDTYSNPIHLGLPHIEKDITCSEEDGENLLTCKITVKSIPEAKAAEWRVQQAPEDVFQAINIHESTFRGSTVSLPHPILNVHGFNPELQRLIQFTATNFIGEKTTVIQSTIGEKYPKEDAVMKETDSHISKYANGSAAVLFANLRYDLIELFPQDKIENIKCLLHGLSIMDLDRVNEMISMSDILNILEKKGYFSSEDVIWVQYCLRKIGCNELYKKCYQYAKQNEALCFYENQPVRNGYKHVGFHVAGNIKKYSTKEIFQIQKTVASMIGCPIEEVIIDGLKPDESFVVVLSIKDAYIDALLALAEQILDNLYELNVDYLVYDEAKIRRTFLGEGATASEIRPLISSSIMPKPVTQVTSAATDTEDINCLSSVIRKSQSHKKIAKNITESQIQKSMKRMKISSIQRYKTMSFTCETCKKDLKNQHKMNMHKSRMHPNVTCEICLREFKNQLGLKIHLSKMHHHHMYSRGHTDTELYTRQSARHENHHRKDRRDEKNSGRQGFLATAFLNKDWYLKRSTFITNISNIGPQQENKSDIGIRPKSVPPKLIDSSQTYSSMPRKREVIMESAKIIQPSPQTLIRPQEKTGERSKPKEPSQFDRTPLSLSNSSLSYLESDKCKYLTILKAGFICSKEDSKLIIDRVNLFVQRLEEMVARGSDCSMELFKSGSYYDITKIGYDDDFDFMFYPKANFEAEFANCPPGYCQIKKCLTTTQDLDKMFNKDGYLVPGIFKEKMFKTFEKCIESPGFREGKRTRRKVQNPESPAFTIFYDLQLQGKPPININLIPAIKVDGWPSTFRKPNANWISDDHAKEAMKCFHGITKSFPGNYADAALLWGVSFSHAERNLIHHADSKDKGVRRTIFKILKKLMEDLKTDCPQIEKFCSYHLKMFILGFFDRHKDFSEKNEEYLFNQSIKELIKCLKGGEIRNYFIPSDNILQYIPNNEKDLIAGKLGEYI